MMDKEVSKKDVIDYLRNQQKAEEIRAKLTGINVWALWGALAIVFWQLLNDALPEHWKDALELYLHLTIASQLAIFVVAPGINKQSSSELRYERRYLFSDSEAPILFAAQLLWTLAPSAAYWALFGLSVGSAFVGGALVAALIAGVVTELMGRYGRFPAPTFERPPNERRVVYSVILLAALVVLAYELKDLFRLLPTLNAGLMKSLLVALSAYWLLGLLLKQHHLHFRDAWTYRLERDLLLNLISVDDALRGIENRTLGARVSDVMADFWRDLENRQKVLKERITALGEAAREIEEIPKDYKDEIRARAQTVSMPAKEAVSALISAHEEFVEYARKVKNSLYFNRNPKILVTIESLLDQHKKSYLISESLKREWEAASRNLERISGNA